MISTASSAALTYQANRSAASQIYPVPACSPRHRPDLPVLRETLLLAELEAMECTIDLETLSQRILGDLGATLQVLRLAGRRYRSAKARPVRIADCISDLGVQACMGAIARQPMLPEYAQSTADLWSYSRAVARQAKQIAEESVGIDPEKAYLVGLCHLIGRLPGTLGWTQDAHEGINSAPAGLALAREWQLPGCVVEYFSAIQSSRWISPWLEIVRAARFSLEHGPLQASVHGSLACAIAEKHSLLLRRAG